MSPFPSLLEQFRAFYKQNNPKDLETAIEYFAVFGGLDIAVDTTRPIKRLIEELILEEYKHHNNMIMEHTKADKLAHALLTGIASGDGRIHSAIKRARITDVEGKMATFVLKNSELINFSYSLETPNIENRNGADVSDRGEFVTPFLRFWFAFVSPLFKGVQAREYREVEERYSNKKQEFSDYIYEKLTLELLQVNASKEDPIISVGSYWDNVLSIELLAKTKSGKLIAGTCKTSKSKSKTSELNKLKELCEQAGLDPEVLVLFSKSGFTKELKELKGEKLRLLTIKNFKKLLEDN
jgi:uncharacterized protein